MSLNDFACCFAVVLVVGAFFSLAYPKGGKRKRKRRRETVYVYALKDGRKKFYIGISNNPKIRLAQHLESANMFGTPKEKKIFWMKKTGRKVKMEIITKANSRTKAEELEKMYIKKWGTHNTLHR